MYFLIDNKNNVIFGWSAKAGCTHIVMLFEFLTDRKDKQTQDSFLKNSSLLHTIDNLNSLPVNISKYTIILFIRNPYERLISCFLDKFKSNGDLYNRLWDKNIPLTFTNFVNYILGEVNK